jgi:phosphoglycolate phosphatase
MKLVLFDIDGTLVSTGMAGADAMQLAFAELFNIPNGFTGIDLSGKTDQAIFQEALERHQLGSHTQFLEVFHERYIPHLRRTLQEPERPRRLMPGLPHLLDVLASRADLILGLLTGNFAIAAQLKLESFHIWHYFQLGAYGSDHSDRNALVPIAQQRTRQALGHEIPAQRVVVIGDTPRDIACAHAHGACAVAVATGNYELEELQRHQPDYCLADLSDVPTMLRILAE